MTGTTSSVTTSFTGPSGTIKGIAFDGTNLLTGDSTNLYIHTGLTAAFSTVALTSEMLGLFPGLNYPFDYYRGKIYISTNAANGYDQWDASTGVREAVIPPPWNNVALKFISGTYNNNKALPEDGGMAFGPNGLFVVPFGDGTARRFSVGKI